MVLGLGLSVQAAGPGAETLYRKLEVLAEVVAAIENHYVDSVQPTDLIYGAARGAVSTLDGQSSFFAPEEYRSLLDSTEGEYGGVGLDVSMRDGAAEVVAVFDDSPAQKAGIGQGDALLAIDGQPTRGLDVAGVQRLLRGPNGTKVVLRVRPRARHEPWTYTLVRAWVRVASLHSETLGGGIRYVRLKMFARSVAKDLQQLLTELRGAPGLVLDLRGNPGGLFDEAVSVCDLFLRDGPIVTAMGRGGRTVEKYRARRHAAAPSLPLAVLVDEGSASAAEIVAGALQDRDRARLFGTRTYGKGSVQSIVDLSDGSGLKLTVARYATPRGRRIEGSGIEPDVTAQPSADAETDAALAAAVAWLAGGAQLAK
jgi:carboxyl-terminal processing protease